MDVLSVHVAQFLLISEIVSCVCFYKVILYHLDIRNLVAAIPVFENFFLLDGDITCLVQIEGHAGDTSFYCFRVPRVKWEKTCVPPGFIPPAQMSELECKVKKYLWTF